MSKPILSPKSPLRILPLGDSALTIEFGNVIDPAVNERVIAFADFIREADWQGVLDVVPTYRSVTVHVDPFRLDLTTLPDRLLRLSQSAPGRTPTTGTLHRIPVVYGSEWGPDLDGIAASAKLSREETIRLHSSVDYRVYMLGFSPGFPYMGLVPAAMAMPRLATPRLTVPAGSVGIADNQTGIYPTASPGGWRLIGRTPLELFRPDRSDPFLLKPGDRVRFEPVAAEDFDRIQRNTHADQH